MAAKIVNGKCICMIDNLEFEVSTDVECDGDGYACNCECDGDYDDDDCKCDQIHNYYITAYNHKYEIEYIGSIGEAADKSKAPEIPKLHKILMQVISVGKVRLEATDKSLKTLRFTEEYVFDDVTITRYQLELHSTIGDSVCQLISRKDAEELKKSAEKALLDRVAQLEKENAELRAKLQ